MYYRNMKMNWNSYTSKRRWVNVCVKLSANNLLHDSVCLIGLWCEAKADSCPSRWEEGDINLAILLHSHTPTKALTHTPTRALSHKHTHIYIYIIYTLTQAHPCICTHIHTYAHSQTCWKAYPLESRPFSLLMYTDWQLHNVPSNTLFTNHTVTLFWIFMSSHDQTHAYAMLHNKLYNSYWKNPMDSSTGQL